MVPLYGITIYRYSKLFFTDKYLIIFVGCISTHGRNRFLSQIRGFQIHNDPLNGEHNIIPVPGAKPRNELSFTLTANITQEVQDESSSSEDESSEDDDDNIPQSYLEN